MAIGVLRVFEYATFEIAMMEDGTTDVSQLV